jgi:hypothetical protein
MELAPGGGQSPHECKWNPGHADFSLCQHLGKMDAPRSGHCSCLCKQSPC